MSSNPFFWPGPTFLSAYLILAGVVLIGYHLWRYRLMRGDEGSSGGDMATDPYSLAYLRGGSDEVLRVATFALLQRNLLEHDGDNRLRARPLPAFTRLRPIEREVLERYAQKPVTLNRMLVLEADWMAGLCEPYRTGLQAEGLLTRYGTSAKWIYRGILLLMLGLAGAKIGYALWSGRSNVLFLLAAALIFWVLMRPPRLRATRRGAQLIADQQVLFSGLRRNADGLSSADDSVWLASAFGLGIFSLAAFPALAWMGLPPAATMASSGAVGGSGPTSSHSCSSSSGDSGGGSGCGGCGGGGGGD